SLSDVGVVGEWWQSAVRDSIYSYRLYIDANGNIYPWHYGSKYFGRAVRCVFITQRRAYPTRLLPLYALNRRVLPISRS
ncbi:hypothetical protein IKE88_01290, partial [Candidatus Saccharibacteria bacterium]|nr:hypothetical protein [Candidatus Saccharibacteria bacterium]